MAERIVEVRMFELRYMCDGRDKPGCDGVMVFTQEKPMVASGVPMFKHVCNKCREVKYIANSMYPMTMGLPIGDPIPDPWIEKLEREHVNNPPPEKKRIIT